MCHYARPICTAVYREQILITALFWKFQPSLYYFSCFPKELVLNLVTLYYAQGVDGVILPYTQGVLTETESRVGAQRTIILIFAHIQMKNKDIASLSSITRPNPSKNQFWFFPFFSSEIKSENETLVSDR